MDEIVGQAGDWVEYTQMNFFEQQKLAGALNLSRDQLADMLLQEEDLAALKDKAIDRNATEAIQAIEQMSAQETFNAALAKMKNLMINLVAKMEGSWFVKNILGLSTDLTQATIDQMDGKTSTIGGNPEVRGGLGPSNGELRVKDFTVSTHPEDELVIAGGTNIAGNDKHREEEMQLLRDIKKYTQAGTATQGVAGFAYTVFDTFSQYNPTSRDGIQQSEIRNKSKFR